MATISLTSELDVISKYEQLMAESLGTDSVYIRAKETIQELANEGDLKDADKAKIISEVVAGLSGSLANACMSTALQWASNEKDTALKKLELGKQLDIFDQDKLLKEAQVDKMMYESVALQAQTKKTYGTPTVLDGYVTHLSNDGKVSYEIDLLEQENINKGKEANILDSKLKESYVGIHKVIADTVTNYGAWNYSDSAISADGLAAAPTRNITAGVLPLSDVQREIAKEQAKGYAYNAWANALTGTSSMLGTAIASELTEFQAGGTGEKLITDAQFITNELKDVTPPAF